MGRRAMNRRDLRYLALEGFVVLFGVLTALIVDGCREDASRRSAAESARDRVVVEVQMNLRELDTLAATVTDRLDRLRRIETDAPSTEPLSELIGRFTGYRMPDFSYAAWERLSGSDLADHVDPDFLNDAFFLYEGARQFDGLNEEIYRLVYSEVFYVPEKRSTAIRISERIMEQQLVWAEGLIPQYGEFLSSAPR